MSVTFYAKDPAESTPARPPARAAYVLFSGPNWSIGTVSALLDLLGMSDRELWGGSATIAEVREGIARAGAAAIDARLARYGSGGYAAELVEFLDAAEAAGATEIYWA